MEIKLTWVDQNPDSEGTRIYRSESKFDRATLPEPIATVAAGVHEYIDSGLEYNKTYYYRFGVFRGGDEALSELKHVLALPYTGPGPQHVTAGDYDIGYFGEVSAEELFFGSEVASQIGLVQPIAINDAAGWIKMANRGKILFIAKRPFAASLNWNDINLAGAVFGEIGGEPLLARKGLDAFVVRLLDGANSMESEWNRLMYPLHEAVIADQLTPKFRTYSNAEMGFTVSSINTGDWTIIQQEKRVRSAITTVRDQGSGTMLRYNSWRPVLEYRPDL